MTGGEIIRRNHAPRARLLAVLLLGGALAGLGGGSANAGSQATNGRIAFVSDGACRFDPAVKNEDVFSMAPDGTGKANLSRNANPDSAPAWSADGTRLAFTRPGKGGGEDVFVMNADGKGQRNLTRSSPDDANPDWAPDGSKVAYDVGGTQIFASNADGTAMQRLIPGGFAPSWAPTGLQIAYTQNVEPSNSEIFVANADGSGARNLTNATSYDDDGAAWSPDGTKIAFTRFVGAAGEIYVMNADGSGLVNLTNDPSSDVGADVVAGRHEDRLLHEPRPHRGHGDLRHERRRDQSGEPHEQPCERVGSRLAARPGAPPASSRAPRSSARCRTSPGRSWERHARCSARRLRGRHRQVRALEATARPRRAPDAAQGPALCASRGLRVQAWSSAAACADSSSSPPSPSIGAVRRTWLAAAALVLLLVSGGAEAQPSGGWLMYGNDPARSSMTETSLLPSALRPAWYTPVSGRISSQALVAENVPAPGQRTVYVATSKGVVYALGENGYIRWRVELGQLDRICQQIDGYGVTGTGVIDPGTHALYLADAFGRMHALDLVTGAERPGWPVQLYTDHRRELVWGAMTLVNGSIYVGTGSYCDRPMVGKVLRVDLATKQVSRWVSVPLRAAAAAAASGVGAASPTARSAARSSSRPGTRFAGGTNVGKRFKESAGYGEHIVELSLDLTVRAAHHPPQMRGRDIGFAGSPVIFRHRVCGDLVAAVNKDGYIYVWRATQVAAGTLFRLRLSSPTAAPPLLSQPAYSPRTGALYVATPGRARSRRRHEPLPGARDVGKRRSATASSTARRRSPETLVWLAENANGGTSLLGFDARSGANRFRAALGGPTYVAPTIVGDRHLRSELQRRCPGLRARLRAPAAGRRRGEPAARAQELLQSAQRLGRAGRTACTRPRTVALRGGSSTRGARSASPGSRR